MLTWSLSLSTSSSNRPGSQSWNISTFFNVSRCTCIAISAFNLSGNAANTRSSSRAYSKNKPCCYCFSLRLMEDEFN